MSSTSSDPCLALVDCNNFYVSCERVFRPDLAKVPVAVLSNNDGCVIARSEEVKQLGVAMGTPYFQCGPELRRAGAVVAQRTLAARPPPSVAAAQGLL